MDALSLSIDRATERRLADLQDAQARIDADHDDALDAAYKLTSSRDQMRRLFDEGDVLDRYLPRGLYDDGGSLIRLLADALTEAGNGRNVTLQMRNICERLARSLAEESVK